MKDRIKALSTELATMTNQAKALYADLEKQGDAATADDRQKLDTLITEGTKKRNEIINLQNLDSLDDFANQPEVEAKARETAAPRRERKSPGQAIIGSEQYKTARARASEGKMDRVLVPGGIKAIYNSSDAQGGYAIQQQREPEVIDIARQRPMSIMALVNQSETEVDAVEYLQMISRTNNAAVVPEYSSGNFGLKPESDISFDLKTAAVKTIATWIPASRQILADAPRLRDTIDNELTYMVEITMENQMLTGDGTGSNFTGMAVWPGIQTRVMSASSPTGRGQLTTDTQLDTLRRAITDIRLEFYEANGIVLNPSDAESLELAKDDNHNYLNVYDPVAQRVWRVAVVETPAITALTALVGNFKLAATLWDRMATEIRVGEPNDFFLRNAVAVLAELRAAFAVTRPKAIEKVTLI
jgi:HK97 family phage major capsid protein